MHKYVTKTMVSYVQSLENKYKIVDLLFQKLLFVGSTDRASSQQGAGKTIEKPLKELPWNQQYRI